MPAGIALSTSRVITCCCTTFCVSMVGDAPDTVMVSSSAPSRISAFTVAVNDDVSSRLSRRTVLKPASVKTTVYGPGTRLTILYWPAPSVTAVRTFSIRAGLAASTETPGMTAPDASFTTPAMALPLCARAGTGTARTIDTATRTPLRHHRAIPVLQSLDQATRIRHWTHERDRERP